MIYLFDADTLITADNKFYPRKRFRVFWDWLLHHGAIGLVKTPLEQYEEVVAGSGDLVDWLKDEATKAALLFEEEANTDLVREVTHAGYANDLDEAELVKIGRDPFLISYGYAANDDRTVVSFEVSAPAKQRANRKIPDVCEGLGVKCVTLFDVIDALDFTTDWKPE